MPSADIGGDAVARPLIVEVASPMMTRPRNPGLYDVPLLTFG
jgi:hypothetical protein